ncbi:GNAT family N-acetyltransferase [Salirhabdus sp. Marseille-P4669]|uniref:GNAT family N-acetyltransferase n=1 Tax=Salirhabdus sp. Marseille-P4669 TaxID=2042310 RepID=UPI000C7B7CAC|nr:GNAT family N-acetyltransferase [Salirhabdus sp. Marseille-P4669]
MEWSLKSFEQFTLEELYSVLKERVLVFVVEQECPYPEIDDYDQTSYHLLLKEQNKLIAYCRLLPSNTKYEEASIGRVLVKESYRNLGLAHKLMEQAVTIMKEEWNEPIIKLQAQSHLQGFYGKHGFKVVSEEYMDDGIPHVDMLLKF